MDLHVCFMRSHLQVSMVLVSIITDKTVSKMTSLVSAGAGWTAGKAWAGAKGAGSAALSGGKAVGRGIMNGARLIFRK